MHFFLLTNYSNYVAFDEALALLDQFKKRNLFSVIIGNMLFYGQGTLCQGKNVLLSAPNIKSLKDKLVAKVFTTVPQVKLNPDHYTMLKSSFINE